MTEQQREQIYDILMLPEGVDEILPIGCPAWVSLKSVRIANYLEGWKSPDKIPNATICPKCNEMHWIR